MSLVVSCRARLLLFALAWPVWAASSVPGIKNFYQVDQHVYRGAQPTDEGFQYLAKIGVKSVIDLREADARSKEEESVVTAAGMKYVNIPMTGLTPPTEAEITRILGILEDDKAGAVFVHCLRGADRTGAVIASYRIDHDGWDNARALSEAKARGMSFFQFPRESFIRTFQRRAMEAAGGPAVPVSSAGTVDLNATASTPTAVHQ
jgi:tyrosine-protein phosphatase SIW14